MDVICFSNLFRWVYFSFSVLIRPFFEPSHPGTPSIVLIVAVVIDGIIFSIGGITISCYNKIGHKNGTSCCPIIRLCLVGEDIIQGNVKS